MIFPHARAQRPIHASVQILDRYDVDVEFEWTSDAPDAEDRLGERIRPNDSSSLNCARCSSYPGE
jgi:hypothetical protein